MGFFLGGGRGLGGILGVKLGGFGSNFGFFKGILASILGILGSKFGVLGGSGADLRGIGGEKAPFWVV